jgi:hypothetical protein
MTPGRTAWRRTGLGAKQTLAGPARDQGCRRCGLEIGLRMPAAGVGCGSEPIALRLGHSVCRMGPTAGYTVAYGRDGQCFDLCRIIFGGDGSYYVTAPYHPLVGSF